MGNRVRLFLPTYLYISHPIDILYIPYFLFKHSYSPPFKPPPALTQVIDTIKPPAAVPIPPSNLVASRSKPSPSHRLESTWHCQHFNRYRLYYLRLLHHYHLCFIFDYIYTRHNAATYKPLPGLYPFRIYAMFPRLPPAITSLVFIFLLAAPALSTPLPDDAPAPAPALNDAPTKLQPRQASQPSRRMGQRRSKKSEPLKQKDYSSFLCPGGSVACPVPPASFEEITPESAATLGGSLNSLADWFKIGFECIELATELNSCGGCLALGQG